LKIAVGGPAVSVALAILYAGGAYLALLPGWDAASLVFQWLATVNVTLVVFNAIPG
jgi:Zn-dependent protease